MQGRLGMSTTNWELEFEKKHAMNAVLDRKETSDERRLQTSMNVGWELKEEDERYALSQNKRRAISAVSKHKTSEIRRLKTTDARISPSLQ